MLSEQYYVLDPTARQSRIDNGGRISRFAFEVSGTISVIMQYSLIEIPVRLCWVFSAEYHLF